MIEQTSKIFDPYAFLLIEGQVLDKFLSTPKTREDYNTKITKYENLYNEISDKIPLEIYMNMIKVNCRPIRDKILQNCDDFINKIRTTIHTHIITTNNTISKDLAL